eukprot:CAMPEP_0181232304 /NCGR_PEP_ID=MMETSP1096-20121128/35651_1 /TAXON_ID=156174 ORGANISM="Chrysochromulina ericina, Strain CCMP281" /NCGR_SAMPLE_ID=MMETSP1096 /ASSEMBLY_ACC=CAM_ASM_000453 /LENGTH=78 /DNA_ID=CAMNT_0023326569 /DNA_START=1 /DNA_END=237 /DNA_ORIENTATION=+
MTQASTYWWCSPGCAGAIVHGGCLCWLSGGAHAERRYGACIERLDEPLQLGNNVLVGSGDVMALSRIVGEVKEHHAVH